MRVPRRTVLVLSISVTVIATVSGLANAGSTSRDATMGDRSPAGSRPLVDAPGSPSDAVTAWNANAGEASVAACFIGGYAPQEARMYAMMHVAIHDALNAIDRRSQPYAVDLVAAPGTSPDAAVAAAARDVLVSVLGSFSFFLPAECIAAGVASVEADYAAALAAIPAGTAKTQGIALGQDAAEAILALRASDGYDTPTVDPNYQEGTAPGEYRYTPGTPFAFAPFLGEDLTPFALTDGSQFRPGPPYRLTSPKYAADVNEVQRLGGDDVTTPSARTDDQTEIALFWVESSPLHVEPDRQDRLDRRGTRSLGERPTVRPAEHRLDGWLHRHVRDEVPLPLLAAGHRHPARGHRRQPGDDCRPDLDAVAGEPTHPGLRLRARRRRRRRRRRSCRRFFHDDR